MRRHEQSEGTRRHRGRNAAVRVWATYRARDVGIRNELAKAQRRNRPPCRYAQRRPVETQRQIEAFEAARAIRAELPLDLNEQCVGWFGVLAPPRRREIALQDNRAVADNNQVFAEWRRKAGNNGGRDYR